MGVGAFQPLATFCWPGACGTGVSCTTQSRRKLEDTKPSHRRKLQSTASCLDPAASNYNDAATTHVQSTCDYTVYGCMNTGAVLAAACMKSHER